MAGPMRIPRFVQPMSGDRLSEERLLDYRRITLVQVAIVAVGLLLSTFLSTPRDSAYFAFAKLLFTGFGAFYSYLLWDMLRTHTRNEWLLRFWLFMLLVAVVMGAAVEFPFRAPLPEAAKLPYVLFIHVSIFPFELTVIYFLVRDVFLSKHISTDKLWGAACVFLTIGITWGSLYDILQMLDRDAFGQVFPLGLAAYAQCVYHSFVTLGGMDSLYVESASTLVRNVTVMEAVWGTLFGVLLIGKLLTLPRGQSPASSTPTP